jgi:hypothetical protein
VIDKGARTVAAVFGGGAAGGTLAQIGVIGEQLSQDDRVDWLKDTAAGLITDIFGLGDDPYNPDSITITAADMAAPPPPMVAGHSQDNKTILYTHKLDLTGTDSSGAVGHCSAYFRVWR